MQDNNTIYSDGTFPAPNMPDNIKETPEYGVAVARAIWGSNKRYIEVRNARFARARQYYKGTQPVTPYLDTLNIDGKQSFINIQFEPRPIAKKFVKIIVDGYMNQSERPKVTSLSPEVKDKKEDIVDNAKWRISHADFINDIEQQSGVQFENKGNYLPETEEEVDFYYGLNNKQREEFLLEKMINFAFKDNNYTYVKRRALKDLAIYAVAGIEDYTDSNGRVIFENIPPEELVYAPSKKENFSDSNYFGRVKSVTIQELRAIPGNKMTEEDLYKLAQTVSNKNGNGNWSWSWDSLYNSSATRPYDGYRINVLRFWYKTIKNINYVFGTDNWGRQIFDIKKDAFQKTNGNKQAGAKPIFVGYEGYWIIDTDKIINWGPSRNQLKRDDELEKVQSPISVFMIDNEGEMDTKSLVEDIISSIIEMDIAILKIQQIKAAQAPNGYIIDIEGLEGIDLGLGGGALAPLKLREIRTQTGDLYYRSKNAAGDAFQQPPVRESKGDFGNMLQELVGNYNFELNNIRDYIGTNEYREGSSVNPKIGLGVVQNQLQNSNNATAYLYDALVQLMRNPIKNIGLRIWDSLRSVNPSKGYNFLLGKENVEFIKSASDITSSLYDMDIELDLSDEDKRHFEEEIQIALSNQTIDVKDIIALRAMPNQKYAAQYLTILQVKREKKMAQAAQQNAEMNQKLQNDSLVQKAQLELQAAQLQSRVKAAEIEAKTQGELDKLKVQFYNDMRKEAFVMGKELPEDIAMEIEEYMQEQKQMKAAAVQQVLEEQQEQQQQEEGQEQDPNAGQQQQ